MMFIYCVNSLKEQLTSFFNTLPAKLPEMSSLIHLNTYNTTEIIK